MFRLMWFYVILCLDFCVKNLRHKKLKLCHIELTSNNMGDFQEFHLDIKLGHFRVKILNWSGHFDNIKLKNISSAKQIFL